MMKIIMKDYYIVKIYYATQAEDKIHFWLFHNDTRSIVYDINAHYYHAHHGKNVWRYDDRIARIHPS